MKRIRLFSICLIILLGCETSGIDELQLVYDQDFEESLDIEWIGGNLFSFQGSQVMGPFNKGEFKLLLDSLPKHDVLLLSFDLLIHDSWDGNLEGLGGPDIWEIKVDRFDDEPPSTAVYQTTFSNGTCDAVRCLYQSYPNQYPHRANPRAGSDLTASLPGRCVNALNGTGTSLYHMQVEFEHYSPLAVIQFKDYLKQTNATSPSCDESWSMDNLKVYTIKY